jgi:transposase
MYEKITGMGYNFIRSDSDQVFLLPPDTRDWLPEGHLAWEIIKVVDTLDLSAFLASYRADGQGRPAYHPKMLVALVAYCYCKGIRSSRAIEGACFDDLGCRVICGNCQADHATIARFVRRHAAALQQLFVQVLAVCARDGLVRVDLVAGDGTKVRANASKATSRTVEQLDVRIGELEAALAAEVAAWFAQAAAEDAAEDALFAGDGDGPNDGSAPSSASASTRKRTADQLARAQAAKDVLHQRHGDTIGAQTALQQARARAQTATARLERVTAAQQAKVERQQQREQVKAAGGKASAGRPPLPVDQAPKVIAAQTALDKAQTALRRAEADPHKGAAPKGNPTDPGSRVMPAKTGGYLQGYNLQALANPNQVILAIGTHDNSTDVGALHPLLNQARANLDAAGITDPIGRALFDAGYAATDNFTIDTEADLYVAVHNETAQTGRGDAVDKTIPAGWQPMAARMATEEAKQLYRERPGIIEPVFAQLFARLGRHLNYRGAMVDVELSLWGTTHNLLKHIRHLASQAMTRPAPTLT